MSWERFELKIKIIIYSINEVKEKKVSHVHWTTFHLSFNKFSFSHFVTWDDERWESICHPFLSWKSREMKIFCTKRFKISLMRIKNNKMWKFIDLSSHIIHSFFFPLVFQLFFFDITHKLWKLIMIEKNRFFADFFSFAYFQVNNYNKILKISILFLHLRELCWSLNVNYSWIFISQTLLPQILFFILFALVGN